MKKVLITGGSGLLGSTASLVMRDQWDISLAVRNHTVSLPGIKCFSPRLEDIDEVKTLLENVRPDYVIHAAGMTSIEDCEANNYKAHLANVLSTTQIAKVAHRAGIKFVYISTDHVASDKERSTEDEIGFPINVYAKTKLEGEFETLRHCPGALVARTNFFTWGTDYRKSFLDFIVDNLRNRKAITLFDDVRFNPLTAELLCTYLNTLLSSAEQGIFNLTLDEACTKYEFGMKVAETFGLDKSLIVKGTLAGNKSLVKRPFNLTLDNSKFKKAIALTSTPGVSSVLQDLKGKETTWKKELGNSFKPKATSKVINYGRQSIHDKDFESVLVGLDSPWLTQGPTVEKFEREVAKYTGSKYAVAMANWTCGLHMAVLATGAKEGDVVITSPISFVASSNCAVYTGAIPYFVDIDPVTLNMNPEMLELAVKKLGTKVKAIIPVHFAGAPCDMEKISAIARQHGIPLIEDAAHAIGGKYLSGEKIGNNRYSQMVGFSFHPVKNMTTGEGGLITTDNETLYKKLLRIRSHGITKGNDTFKNTEEAYTQGQPNPWYYEMLETGYNYRITDLQCALGLSQLSRLNEFLERKISIVQSYDREFEGLKNMKVIQAKTRTLSGNHLYVINVNFTGLGISRFELFSRFRERGINLHLHYIPIYRQPFYKENYASDLSMYPNSEAYYAGAVTLPVFPEMREDEVARVIKAVKELIG